MARQGDVTRTELALRAARLADAAIARAGGVDRLAGDVARLSRLFTTARGERASGYMNDPALRRAYLGFFAPLNAIKIAALVARLDEEERLSDVHGARVLDVGAGPLTASLGLALARGAPASVVGVDRAASVLDEGRALFAALAPEVAIELVAEDARRLSPRVLAGTYDVIFVANALNELGDPRRALAERLALLERLLGTLAPDGVLVVVEPATRVHTRALQALRDALVARHGDVVRAPCPSGLRRCPLNDTAGDWCFADLPWTPPPALALVERRAGLANPVLQTSYLVVGRPLAPRDGVRVIGGVMRDRAARDGFIERRYVCGRAGRRTLVGTPSLDEQAREAPRGTWLPIVDAPLVEERDRGPRRPHASGRARRRR